MIKFADEGTTYEGYLCPASSGHGPGLIVLQEWWGLVPHIKAVADRFAAEGFTAFAPDLYGGKTTTEPDEAASLMMALGIGDTAHLVKRAIEVLKANPACGGSKVGVVGFCMGGQLALYAACGSQEIGACVDFYGIHPSAQPALRALSGPLLGIFAEHDDYVGPQQVGALSQELSLLDKHHEFITYPGVGHAFFNDTRAAYNKAAAEDAWKRVVAFLRENLG